MKRIRLRPPRFVYININSRPHERHWSDDARCKHPRVKYMHETRFAQLIRPILCTFHSVSRPLPTLSSSSLSLSLSLRTTLVAVSTWFRACQVWKMSRYFSPDMEKIRETIELFRYRQKEFLFTAHKFLSDIYRLRTALRPSSAMDETRVKHVSRRLLRSAFPCCRKQRNIC